ncbi:MAG: molybdenum cofactor guanylyltransferase [Candidatus Hecatellaceae archaeon]
MKVRGVLVLAGGESRRLKVPCKALLDFGGKPLIARVVSQALKVSSLIVVSLAKNASLEAFQEVLPSGVELVKDRFEGLGPLEGFRHGMRRLGELGAEYALALACDLPFLNAEALGFMLGEAEKLKAEALIPRWPNGFTEALHSVYQPEPMSKASSEALNAGQHLIMDAVKRLKRVFYLDVDGLRRFDPQLLTLTNINTRQDLEEALAKLKG